MSVLDLGDCDCVPVRLDMSFSELGSGGAFGVSNRPRPHLTVVANMCLKLHTWAEWRRWYRSGASRVHTGSL